VHAFTLAASLGLACGLAACSQFAPATPADPIPTRGELRSVTVNLPACHYLAKDPATQAGLAADPADIAAVSLTNTPGWSAAGNAGGPYTLVPPLVFYQRNGVHPRDTLQLDAARIAVRAGSAQERTITPGLLARLNAFFRDLRASGQLARLAQESGDMRRFEHEESREFRQHVGARLPRYRSWFEEAAAAIGVDWRLLAAIGYQESRWDPHAQSVDGALGVMMLTADTAQAMGVRDRANPQQSIFAGARYLGQVRAMIPERIPEPDRTWLTVAAYNVGFGHLEDARIITQTLGNDPDSWPDVRARLPLLAQERWYARARRGYARGREPVQFVDRIQRYLTLLAREPGDSSSAAASARAAPAPSGSAAPAPVPQTPAAAAPLPAATMPGG